MCIKVVFNHVPSTCEAKRNLLKRNHWFCGVTLAEVKRKPSSTLPEMKEL